MYHSSIGVQIANACTQNWQTMPLNNDGRFCGTCNTQVTDFTQYSNAQILQHIQQHGFGGCGRFANHQLNKSLTKPKKWRMKKILAAIISCMALQQGLAQLPVYDTTVYTLIRTANTDSIILQQQRIKALTTAAVKGRITDDKGKAIAEATVTIGNGFDYRCNTDSDGDFSIQWPFAALTDYTTLTIEAKGMKKEVRSLHWTELPATVTIQMQPPQPCACPVTMGTITPSACCDLRISMSVDKLFVQQKSTKKKHR